MIASTVHGRFGPTMERKTIKNEIRGRKTQKSWATVGTPKELAFSNLNQIAQRERRWILLVQTHAYMCSARDLEYARLRT